MKYLSSFLPNTTLLGILDDILSPLRAALSVLSVNPEHWINFSPGQNTKPHFARLSTRPAVSFSFGRFLLFLRWFLPSIILKFNPYYSAPSGHILIFADTVNQLSVLDDISHDLSSATSVCSLYKLPHDLPPHCNSYWKPIKFPISLCLFAIPLFLLRFTSLFRNLYSIDKRLLSWRLDGFLTIYIWLPFFYIYLSQTKPSFVLVSNDHNPSTRSLIELCRLLKIKTGYVQHASTSARFHQLQFSYSFLDGLSSYESYLSCEGRLSPLSTTEPNRHVFLTGIQRNLSSSVRISNTIGIAFKEADGVNELVNLVTYLLPHFQHFDIRCHPATSHSTIVFIQQSFNSKFVRVTKAQDTPVCQYLASLRCLIAGNSSIHLESAICSCPSIYFELKSQFSSDYYGFARKNICLSSSSKSSLLAILLDIFSPNYCFSPNIESIQYYSASFGTKWQGKESQLVSSLIQQLSAGKTPSKLWGYRHFSPLP